jgi:transposase
MEELETYDRQESRKLMKDELQHKLDTCKVRKKRYGEYRDLIESTGESQLSLTDPASRLMKQNEGFCVGYNKQTAVDAGSHMITAFHVTNSPTDHGQITEIATEVKKDCNVDTLEITADKGYECPEDHTGALASGIIPNVIQRDGSCTEKVTFDYREAPPTDEQKAGSDPEDLRACLAAGVIPDACNGILTDVEIVEVKRQMPATTDSAVLNMSPDEMLSKALEGYFVRDAARNPVYCPQGNILRQKSEKQNGDIRYCNRLACKKCPNKCTVSKFKEADFSKDTLIKAESRRKKRHITGKNAKDNIPPKEPGVTVVKKTVRYALHPDPEKMNNRKCLSEHPFGTIKRTPGLYCFLLKGFVKVEAETGLFCLSYSIRRAINLKGVPALSIILGDYAPSGPGYSSVYIRRALPCAVDKKAFSLNAAFFSYPKRRLLFFDAVWLRVR